MAEDSEDLDKARHDTVQDEASDDAETTIDSLVDLEVAKIFAFLTLEERQDIRSVCSRWRKVVDTNFGMKIRIKNSTSDLIFSCPHAFDVELHSMTIPFESGISFADSVKHLRFTSMVVTYNLANFLRNCSGIKTLSFTNVVIDQPVGDEWSRKFWKDELVLLPSLDKIEIKCFNFAEGISDITRLLHDRVQFGNLKEIIILAQNPPTLPLESLFTEQPDLSEAHCILQLLWKNQESLERFQIGRQNYPIMMKFLNRAKHREPQFPMQRQEFVARIQLEEFVVHPYFREEWAPILNSQYNLKSLDIGSVNVSRWEDIRQAIIRNSPYLENFIIGGLSFGQVWDCTIFETCVSLQSLHILISHSHKINLHRIPPQLVHLHMFGPVSRDELVAIAENLVNLETIKFSHLGRIAIVGAQDPDEKINLTLIKALLKLPKLLCLSFLVCSSVSIDWDKIAAWCRRITSEEIQLVEHFYQLHGETCRNGLTVNVSRSFDRDLFMWDAAESSTTAAGPDETSGSIRPSVTTSNQDRADRRSVHFNMSTFSFP